MPEVALFIIGTFYGLITFVAVWMVAVFEPDGADKRSGDREGTEPLDPLEADRGRDFPSHDPVSMN